MDDYISREAAVEQCKRHSDYTAWSIKDGIEAIPAADVEPVRQGNWNIRVSGERTLCLECSECGRKVDNINLHRLLIFGEYGEACRSYPYCHCGAKMQGYNIAKMDLEDENNENFNR